jgi:hypothetical protein
MEVAFNHVVGIYEIKLQLFDVSIAIQYPLPSIYQWAK